MWLSDYDAEGGDGRFKTSLTDPAPRGEVVYLKAWLWTDTADDTRKITLENVINRADERSPWTYEVALTYGGSLNAQRYLVRVAGRRGRYPMLQFQHQGHDERHDHTRRVFRDDRLDWYWDDEASELVEPPATGTVGDLVAVPTAFVFDRGGKLVKTFYGAPPELKRELEALVKQLASKKGE